MDKLNISAVAILCFNLKNEDAPKNEGHPKNDNNPKSEQDLVFSVKLQL